jgi:hypothetical protein
MQTNDSSKAEIKELYTIQPDQMFLSQEQSSVVISDHSVDRNDELRDGIEPFVIN